jgi:hypothetical protein
LGNNHRATGLELGVEGDGAAAEFDGMVMESLLCGSVTYVSDFEVRGIQVVFDYSSYIGLHQSLVFEKFAEWVTVIAGVQSICILGIDAGCVRVFLAENVSDGFIEVFVALLVSVFF